MIDGARVKVHSMLFFWGGGGFAQGPASCAHSNVWKAARWGTCAKFTTPPWSCKPCSTSLMCSTNETPVVEKCRHARTGRCAPCAKAAAAFSKFREWRGVYANFPFARLSGFTFKWLRGLTWAAPNLMTIRLATDTDIHRCKISTTHRLSWAFGVVC